MYKKKMKVLWGRKRSYTSVNCHDEVLMEYYQHTRKRVLNLIRMEIVGLSQGRETNPGRRCCLNKGKKARCLKTP
jgi:hypothetical protein